MKRFIVSTSLVSVCLCTFKRLSLIDTIAGISIQNLPPGVSLEIIVIDSDLQRSAKKIIEDAKSRFNLEIKDFVADKSGISSARNKAIKEATGEWLVFIDDDEVPDCNWIKCLLSCASEFSSTVVFGEVKTIYPSGTPDWIVKENLFGKQLPATGTIVTHGPTSNALVLRKLVENQPYLFNEAFGVTGGEDTEFFYRLYKDGAKMVTSKESIVFETVEHH
ncbi:MAG TPA: glycosyltransferase, partial [Emticicia sp.]